MAGYVGTTAQWKHVEADWAALVAKAGVRHIHAVDLFRRTKQFRGWKPEDVNALALSLDGVIARYLQLGFSVIVRDDDYKNIYGAEPHPRRPVKDTKYGVCFRAWLAFVPSFIASELKLAGQGALAEPTRIDFALEGGHANVGDARRLFELYKKDALPEWQHLIGEFDTSTKDSVGAQAADFLAYAVNRAELLNTARRRLTSKHHPTSPIRP
jgi:hypothetical protein